MQLKKPNEKITDKMLPFNTVSSSSKWFLLSQGYNFKHFYANYCKSFIL